MTQEATQITTNPPLPGLQLVQDLNKALQTLGTDFAGSSDPAALAWPYATWADTGTGTVKRRNAANSAWVVEGRLFRSHLPMFAPGDVPVTDIGPIYVIGNGPAEWDGSGYVPLLASESRAGAVRFATTAEAQALTNDTKALTPAKLAAAFGGGNHALSSNGYQKLPNGLIVQWGQKTTATGADATFTFPIAFPNAMLGFPVATPISGSGSLAYSCCFGAYSNSSVNISAYNTSGARVAVDVGIIAIGY